MNTTKRRWWRVAAAAVLGGTAVGGGWFGIARYASADPVRQPGEPVWTRSASSVGNPPAADPKPVAPAGPTVAEFKASPEVVPVSPAGASLPAIPTINPAVLPPIPAPTAPTTPPVAPPPMPVKPPEFKPALPTLPDAPPALPMLPAPVPALPAAPPVIAPPAPPAKSADSAKPLLPPPDFNLRPGDGGNSVKPGDPTPPTLPAPPVGVAPPPSPIVPVDRPKPADGPLVPSEKYVFPLPGPVPAPVAPPLPTPPMIPIPGLPTPPDTPRAPTPGDPTMTNTFKPTALAAVIGGALAFAPAKPAAALPVPAAPVKADAADPTPAELKKQLDDIEKKVNRLIEAVEGRRDKDGIPYATDRGVVSDVKDLKDEIARLNKQIEAMKNSTSLRPGGPAVVTGKGIVRVVNEYPVEVSIVVNEKSYRVAPNTKLDIEIPVGDFSYQLLQAGVAPVKSVIKEKEVVTLRIK